DETRPVEHMLLETRLGADDVPTAARYVIDNELQVDVDVVAATPVPLVAPDGRTSRFPRALCTYTTSRGTGTGWCEWLQGGLPVEKGQLAAGEDDRTRKGSHVPAGGRRHR